jgi:virginiamycin B lyase
MEDLFMWNSRFLALVAAAAAVVIWAVGPAPVRAQSKSKGSVALTGLVSSKEEGPMEGVLVGAKKEGSTITTTVVSDAKGRYSFPASRMEPGQYSLRIRATGYDLEGPGAVQIAPQKTATADLKLVKTKDLAAQLMSIEWLNSFPGTEEQKASIRNCDHCHTLEPIVRSKHNADEFVEVMNRMSRLYTPESFPGLIQPPPHGGRIGGEKPTEEQRKRAQENRRRQAEYLSTVNLSSGPQWSYELKTLPRPTGMATRVIYTEYDLPKPTRQPHDVVVDSKGNVWYGSFGEPIIGRLDPKTGKITEWPVPVLKPGYIFGILGVELDEDENLWFAMTFQAAVAKFDTKTEKLRVYELPPDMNGDYREMGFVGASHTKVDGKVWVSDFGTYTMLRLDVDSGKYETLEPFPFPRPQTYQVSSDSHNNAWFTILGGQSVGRIDAKTGKPTIFDLPTPRSGPRRAEMDSKDRYWFSENRTNKFGMIDTKTEKLQEWQVPKQYFITYDVTGDKNGEAWVVSELSDGVIRYNPQTSQFTEYLLPRHANLRKAYVDNSTTPVTFWVGNNHGASIVKVEPLESE